MIFSGNLELGREEFRWVFFFLEFFEDGKFWIVFCGCLFFVVFWFFCKVFFRVFNLEDERKGFGLFLGMSVEGVFFFFVGMIVGIREGFRRMWILGIY